MISLNKNEAMRIFRVRARKLINTSVDDASISLNRILSNEPIVALEIAKQMLDILSKQDSPRKSLVSLCNRIVKKAEKIVNN